MRIDRGIERPNAVMNAMSGEPAECREHCVWTWQCEVCGALVHGKEGADKHQEWHGTRTA